MMSRWITYICKCIQIISIVEILIVVVMITFKTCAWSIVTYNSCKYSHTFTNRWSRVSRSVIHLTRLETRTKEPNMYASRTVLHRLVRRNKHDGVILNHLDDCRATPTCSHYLLSWTAFEHTCWYPKDGELYLGKTKPEETLVEVCSDSDVQIDRQTWV
jgi:hypothetical protein